MLIPRSLFPEIRLPAPAPFPPIRLFVFDEAGMSTPLAPLGIAFVPAGWVPMKFPWMTLPAPEITTPSPVLPEITLRATALVPPTTLFDELNSDIPLPLGRA